MKRDNGKGSIALFMKTRLDETSNRLSSYSTGRDEENKAKINHVHIVKNADRKISDQ